MNKVDMLYIKKSRILDMLLYLLPDGVFHFICIQLLPIDPLDIHLVGLYPYIRDQGGGRGWWWGWGSCKRHCIVHFGIKNYNQCVW